MSNDDFFIDRDNNILQYIHSKSSTKIDDILKRRQWKKLQEENLQKTESFLSIEETGNKTNKEFDQWNNITDNYNERNEYMSKDNAYETNSFSKKLEGENTIYTDKENCIDKIEYYDSLSNWEKKRNVEDKGFISEHTIGKRLFSDMDDINEVKNYVASQKSIEERYDIADDRGTTNSFCKLKSNITSYNSIASEIDELDKNPKNGAKLKKSYDNFLVSKEVEDEKDYTNVNRNETDIDRKSSFQRKMNILKTPSTELLLNKMKSNEEERQEENFINLNKISALNDIDMNRTPTKSFSQSYSKHYADYIKCGTAGKMNMSELETPCYMKEEEQGNTPILAYYLAGKVREESVEKRIIEEDNSRILSNGYISSYEKNDEEIQTSDNIREFEKISLHEIDIGTESKRKMNSQQIKDYIKLTSYRDKNENGSINGNTKETNIYEIGSTASNKTNNKYYDEDIYRKINSSKKYNFLKTEKQYDEIMKKRSKILHDNNNENIEKKNSYVNEINFMDNNNSISPFNIMNSKTFKTNFFSDMAANKGENKIYSSNFNDQENKYKRDPSIYIKGSVIEPSVRKSTLFSNASYNKEMEKENNQNVMTAPEIYNIDKPNFSSNIFTPVSSNKDIVMERDKKQNIQNEIDKMNKRFTRNSFEKRNENEWTVDSSTNIISDKCTNKNDFISFRKSSNSFFEKFPSSEYMIRLKTGEVHKMNAEDALINARKIEENLVSLGKNSECHNVPEKDEKPLNENEKDDIGFMKNNSKRILNDIEKNNEIHISKEMSPEYIKFLNDIKGTYVNFDEEKVFGIKREYISTVLSKEEENDDEKKEMNVGKEKERKEKEKEEEEEEEEEKEEKEKEKEKEVEKKKEIENSFANYEICRREKNIPERYKEREKNDEMIERNENSSNVFNHFDNTNIFLKEKNRKTFNMLRETADFGRKEIMNQSMDSPIKKPEVSNRNFETEKILFNKNEIDYSGGTKESSFDYTKSNLSKVNTSDIKKMILNSYNVAGYNLDIPFEILQKEVNTNNEINEYIKEQIKNNVNSIIEKILTDKEKEISEKLEQSISQKRKKGKDNKERDDNFNGEWKDEEDAYKTDREYKRKVLHRSNGYNSNNYTDEINSGESINVINMRKLYEGNDNNNLKSDKSHNSFKRKNEQQQKEGFSGGMQEREERQELDEEDIQEINKLNENLKMNKVNKMIKINKKDVEKGNVSIKKVMYNCIDLIYHLLNEQKKKNNKLNSLMNEIGVVNECEKRIEKLTEVNEQLRKELELKNEHLHKKEVKDKATLNKKIADQAIKITTYEKDLTSYKNKINKLNNKLSNKDKEIENLKTQYQSILEEIENCKVDATKVVKKIINKKNINVMEKSYIELSKYYEIQVHSLNKEIKNMKNLMKNNAKEKLVLLKKIEEFEEMKKKRRSETSEIEKEHTIKSEKETTNVSNTSMTTDFKKEELESEKMEYMEEAKDTEKKENYKIKYEKLYKEMKEIKKDLEEQKKLYNKKINNLEQSQEMQNMKNQLNETEKIVEIYQNIFKEKVNTMANNGSLLGFCHGENKEDIKNGISFLHNSDNNDELQRNSSYVRYCTNDSNHKHLNNVENKNNMRRKSQMENMFLESEQFCASVIDEAPQNNTYLNNVDPNSSYQNNVFHNSLFGIHSITSGLNKNGRLFSSKRHLAKAQQNTNSVNTNNSLNIPESINNHILNNFKNVNYENYLNDFVKMFIQNTEINDNAHLEKEYLIFKKNKENEGDSKSFLNYDASQNELLYKHLLNYEKEKLIEIFINICTNLKTDNIFIIVHFVKFLSFIVYEQFPLFSSFYYTIASLTSIKSIHFNECIEIVKKWKTCYAHGKRLYYFRKNVLLIFKSHLQNVKKELIDEECVNLIKNIYDKNSEIDKFSKDSCEKAEHIINKHAKELISRIIKTYMNIYKIEKINSIIEHMNSMNAKFKTQSYFVRSVSTCLNLNRADNLQEIEDKIKDLTSSKEIGDKLKNKIKIEDIDEYLAAYTILNTLKKYLNITQTKDLLPSISKIIQKNRSFHL